MMNSLQEEMVFEDDELEIKVKLIPAVSRLDIRDENMIRTLIISITLARLRLNWNIIEKSELTERWTEHPLGETIASIKGINNCSLSSDHIILTKKEKYQWEPIIGRLVHILFEYEKLRQKTKFLIASLEV